MKASVCIERVDLQLRGGRRCLWTGKLCRLFDVPPSDVVLTEAALATAFDEFHRRLSQNARRRIASPSPAAVLCK